MAHTAAKDREKGEPVSYLIVSVLAVLCFVAPFSMFYLSSQQHPGNAEAAGFAVLIPAALTWLAAAVLALGGLALSLSAMKRSRYRWLPSVAAGVDGSLVVLFLAIILRAVVIH